MKFSSTINLAKLLQTHRLAAATAASTSVVSFIYSTKPALAHESSFQDKDSTTNGQSNFVLTNRSKLHKINENKHGKEFSNPQSPLATSSLSSNQNNSHKTLSETFVTKSENKDTQKLKSMENMQVVDYAIVGNGTAGKAALKTIQLLHPSATVAVIEPFHQPESLHDATKQTRNVLHFPSTATYINHEEQSIELKNGSFVNYRNSVLLSTGSRGAPPPKALLEATVMNRILELKSTDTNSTLDPNSNSHVPATQLANQLPTLAPAMVRNVALMAAAQGAHVTVLGSGMEALELAAAISATVRTSGVQNNSQPKCTLVLGNSSPLSSNIPHYLKASLMKRLKQNGIQVHSRSLIRYISLIHPSSDDFTKDPPSTIPKLEIHLSKSYDTLDTQRIATDLVIVAPTTLGKSGTAVMPIPKKNELENQGALVSKDDKHHFGANLVDSSKATYQAWSHLVSDNVVSCYSNDGRIVVNAELNAASGIYAAGSVAKYPNDEISGDPVVAGVGISDASLAGEIAATNMVKEYEKAMTRQKANRKRRIKDNRIVGVPVFVKKSLPLHRTDLCSYIHNENNDGDQHQASKTNSLEALGVQALCVGTCDSENMATHGFWWTNQADDLRRARMRENGHSKNVHMRRRITARMSRSKRAVYGTGVVFYLDRTGRICGLMTWGLSFTDDKDENKMNGELLDRIKLILESNGEVCKSLVREKDKESTEWGESQDSILGVHHLAEESKNLFLMASNHGPKNGMTMNTLPRPLHRYVPSKPAAYSNLGSLKRNKGNHGTEEHLFMKRLNLYTSLPDIWSEDKHRPPSLLHIHPMESNNNHRHAYSNTALNTNNNMKEQKESDDRSRPPREDPLWLYQNEQHKSYAIKDVMTDIFLTNLRKGQFSDGSDALPSPPMPRSVQNATATIMSFFENDDGDDDFQEEVDEDKDNGDVVDD